MFGLKKSINIWPSLFLLSIIFSGMLAENESSLETSKNILAKKKEWLDTHLARTRSKRSVLESSFYSKNRPCPSTCNCNYETMNCNDLISECPECEHWSEIDFNQIQALKRNTFKHFKFASNRTTQIIIYKLINSTLVAEAFNGLVVPENSHLEITFQYNSVIKFDKHALTGIHLKPNSTLVFNFPYTTQVIFVSKCFDGIHMDHHNSKLILRILKSFSVRFVNDFIVQGFLDYKRKLRELSTQNITSLESIDIPNPERNINKENSSWAISKGQIIIDIKSTHFVKFEDFSFAYLQMRQGAKFYLDLDLIEKFMIQRHAFSNLNLGTDTKLTIYARHLTFIDFRAHSFSEINLASRGRMQIYLEELLHSLCLQRNVFDKLTLNENSHFNFSTINSKNVMLMHDSFSNLALNGPHAKLYIAVYNRPSFQLSLEKNNYYQEFLKERLIYKWSTYYGSSDPNSGGYDQYSGIYQPPFPISTDYFYSSLDTEYIDDSSLKKFYRNHKQAYAYNISIEKNAFSNLQFNFNEIQSNNVWLVADNVNTFLVDNSIVSSRKAKFKNINFLLNVQHFILNSKSFQSLNRVRLEFLKEPKVLDLGIYYHQTPSFKSLRQITIKGLKLNKLIDEEDADLDYQIAPNLPKTRINNYCQIARMSILNTIVNFESRFTEERYEPCSCQTVYLLMNQIKKSNNLDGSILNCKLDQDLYQKCEDDLTASCNVTSNKTESGDYRPYVKFWEFCISETDPEIASVNKIIDGKQVETGNYYFQNFNDPDGMFSASLSSSSFYDQADSYKSSLSQPDESIPESFNDIPPASISSNITNVGKVVGGVIVFFLVGIVLFMIIVNVIQYKFRNELLDDLEYSSQPTNTNNINENSNFKMTKNLSNIECYEERATTRGANPQKFWKKTFSATSLRRTLSVASLRSKRELNRTMNDSHKLKVLQIEQEEVESSSEDERETYSDSDYTTKIPHLRSEKECDSIFDDDLSNDSDNDDSNDDKYSKSRDERETIEKRRLKYLKSKSNRTNGNTTDSGNPSEINQSPINSNHMITPQIS